MKAPAWMMRVWPLALIALIALVLWASRAPEDGHDTLVACTTLASGCTVQADGREIRLGMVGDLKPLVPFQIWVKAAGLVKAEARFQMEGMEMGFNLYTLRADNEGVFRATVTLPICVTGRRDWRLLLDVDKTRLTVPFVTEL